MKRRPLKSDRILIGTIIDRSTDDPAAASDITYDVAVNMPTGGVVTFRGVTPPKNNRPGDDWDTEPAKVGTQIEIQELSTGALRFLIPEERAAEACQPPSPNGSAAKVFADIITGVQEREAMIRGRHHGTQ